MCLSHINVCRVLSQAKLLCYVSNVINKPYIKSLGRRIIELRQAMGLSQETLANLADIPVNQIGRIERGEINTTVSTVYAIAKAFGMQLPELFIFPATKTDGKKGKKHLWVNFFHALKLKINSS